MRIHDARLNRRRYNCCSTSCPHHSDYHVARAYFARRKLCEFVLSDEFASNIEIVGNHILLPINFVSAALLHEFKSQLTTKRTYFDSFRSGFYQPTQWHSAPMVWHSLSVTSP